MSVLEEVPVTVKRVLVDSVEPLLPVTMHPSLRGATGSRFAVTQG